MGRVVRWRRWLFRRLVRLQGTAHSVARGVGIGVFVGFLMPPGLQLIVAIPLAFVCRANVIAAAAGTMVTNPFTYVPFYFFTCKVGELFLQLIGMGVHLGANLKTLLHDICRFDIVESIKAMRPILAAWVSGGIIVGIATGVPAYYVTYLLMIEVRKLRDFSRARRTARQDALRERMHVEDQAPSVREPDEEAPDEQPPPPPD